MGSTCRKWLCTLVLFTGAFKWTQLRPSTQAISYRNAQTYWSINPAAFVAKLPGSSLIWCCHLRGKEIACSCGCISLLVGLLGDIDSFIRAQPGCSCTYEVRSNVYRTCMFVHHGYHHVYVLVWHCIVRSAKYNNIIVGTQASVLRWGDHQLGSLIARCLSKVGNYRR